MTATVGLDHLTLTVTDLERAQRLYDAALGPLGLSRLVDYLDPEDEDEAGVEAVGYGAGDGRAVMWLVQGAQPTVGVHVALRAADADAVRGFFAAATAAGATAHRPPRPWAIYRAGQFSAIVGDEHGNLVEASAPPAAGPARPGSAASGRAT